MKTNQIPFEMKIFFVFFLFIETISSAKATDSTEVRDRVKKRSFQAYPSYQQRTNSISIFKAANVWKPSSISVDRPYFIPVYGVRGHLPIFYPPQPFHNNVGTPVDNPLPSSFQAPGYLPPEKESPSKNVTISTSKNGTSMDVGTRFGDDYDDAPVWSNGNSASFSGGFSGDVGGGGAGIETEKEWGYIPPTRVPAGNRPTFPPLVHRPEPTRDTSEPDEIFGSRPQQSAVQLPQQQFQRPAQQFPALTTTRRIPPTTTTQRPTTTTTTTTTTATPIRSGPSNCVWAIISCCSVASPAQVPHNCFEQRGCPGPFWGSSPCQSEYARAAIEIAVNYYKRNNSK